MDYQTWASRWPQAAAEFEAMMAVSEGEGHGQATGPEALAQKKARRQIATVGDISWRNNVGATPAKTVYVCPHCGFKGAVSQQPIRFGLCNDSSKLNAKFKSSDLIGIHRVPITAEMVGQVIGQFAAWELKKPGWQFNPNDPHQLAQANYLQLVQRFGGRAMFSTGPHQI